MGIIPISQIRELRLKEIEVNLAKTTHTLGNWQSHANLSPSASKPCAFPSHTS